MAMTNSILAEAGGGSAGRRLRLAAMVAAATLAVGCDERAPLPRSEGEKNSGYAYIPLDPLPVSEERGRGCRQDDSGENALRPVLQSLPDNAVRMAVQQLDAKGSISAGPASGTVKGTQYKVTLDYINADAVNIRVKVTRLAPGEDGEPGRIIAIKRVIQDYSGAALEPEKAEPVPAGRVIEEVVIPVYVGVGLRLTAFVTADEANAKLGSLGALGVEAEAKRIRGWLVVQTLGITGKQVTSSLPLPSDLNQTSIQNAIVSLGAVKAIVYDDANTVIYPRVTGIYNPFEKSDARTVNLIVSELAREPLPWFRACVEPARPRR
jgi:hypothetical protein